MTKFFVNGTQRERWEYKAILRQANDRISDNRLLRVVTTYEESNGSLEPVKKAKVEFRDA